MIIFLVSWAAKEEPIKAALLCLYYNSGIIPTTVITLHIMFLVSLCVCEIFKVFLRIWRKLETV